MKGGRRSGQPIGAGWGRFTNLPTAPVLTRVVGA